MRLWLPLWLGIVAVLAATVAHARLSDSQQASGVINAAGASADTPTATSTPTETAVPPTPTASATPLPPTPTPTQVIVRRGLRFDGVNDVATARDSNSLDLTTAITIEAWVRFDTLPRDKFQTIVLKRSSSNLAYALYYHDGIRFEIRSDGSNVWAEDRSQLEPGRWYHVAGTFDGWHIRTFIDGVLTASTSRSGTIEKSGGKLTIGDNAVWTWEQLDGDVDAIRISASARYSAAFTAPTAFVADAATVALWQLNEGAGQASADSGGLDNTLTLGGSPRPQPTDPQWFVGP